MTRDLAPQHTDPTWWAIRPPHAYALPTALAATLVDAGRPEILLGHYADAAARIALLTPAEPTPDAGNIPEAIPANTRMEQAQPLPAAADPQLDLFGKEAA